MSRKLAQKRRQRNLSRRLTTKVEHKICCKVKGLPTRRWWKEKESAWRIDVEACAPLIVASSSSLLEYKNSDRRRRARLVSDLRLTWHQKSKRQSKSVVEMFALPSSRDDRFNLTYSTRFDVAKLTSTFHEQMFARHRRAAAAASCSYSLFPPRSSQSESSPITTQ